MAKTDIDISEGGFWFSTDSRKLWSPTVVVPATLIAVFFILARFRDGYDGIANILSTVLAILQQVVSAPGFALVVITVFATMYLWTRPSTKTNIRVFLTVIYLVFLFQLLEKTPAVLEKMPALLEKMPAISTAIFDGVTKILPELKPFIDVLAAYHMLPQILVFLFSMAVLHHLYN